MIIETAVLAFGILIFTYLLILKSPPQLRGESALPSGNGEKVEAVAESVEDATGVTKAVPASNEEPESSHGSDHEKSFPVVQSEGHENSPGRTRFISIAKEGEPKKSPAMEELASLFGLGALSRPLEKDLSVLRIDIANIQELREKLDDTSYFQVMNLFYSQLITLAETFQGEINHFDGHWALLAFGRILLLDDHRQSALNAANAVEVLIKEIGELYGEISDDLSAFVPLKVKIAVASGTVIAGPLGKDIRQIFTLFGGPVNKVEELVTDAEPFVVVTD